MFPILKQAYLYILQLLFIIGSRLAVTSLFSLCILYRFHKVLALDSPVPTLSSLPSGPRVGRDTAFDKPIRIVVGSIMALGGQFAFANYFPSWKICPRSHLFHWRWGIWIWVRPVFCSLISANFSIIRELMRGSCPLLHTYLLRVRRTYGYPVQDGLRILWVWCVLSALDLLSTNADLVLQHQ